MKLSVVFALILCSTAAHAWDCSQPKWQQSTNPNGKCYVPPKTVTAAPAQHQAQGQLQGQQQGQVAAARADASLSTNTSNSGNFNYREAALPVSLPPIFVSGCGSGFGAGAGAIKGSALFDYTHISKKCWRMLAAYGMLSAGYSQNACAMYAAIYEDNSQDTSTQFSCPPPAPPVVIQQAPAPAGNYVTQEELQAIIKRRLIK